MKKLDAFLITLISVALFGSGLFAQQSALPNDNSSKLGQNDNSVFNILANEYLMQGDKSAYTELINNATNPKNYKGDNTNILGGSTVYGYVAYDPTSTLPNGPVSFDIEAPGTMTSLGTQTSGDFMAGGSWAEDTWYAIEYATGALYTIDVISGEMTLIGASGLGFNCLAYDPSGSVMYGVYYDGISDDYLYTIDLTTGAATEVGFVQTGGLVIGLACNSSGELFATDIITDQLISINPATGEGTNIGPLGIDISFAQSLEYDNENDILYAGAYTTSGQLYTVDPTTGTATYVAEFQGGSEITAMAIPYSAVSYDNDLGIQAISSPNSGVDLTATEAVTVRIKNYGVNAQSDFNVTFTLDGGTPVTETIAGPLNPGETLDHTFGTTVDLSAYGIYEIVACVELEGDENPGNDCKTKTVINDPPSFCEASTGSQDEYIGNVSVGSINNTSDWQPEVADYTDQSAAIAKGESLAITVTNGGNFWPEDLVTVWVDWNDDYVLEMGGNEEFPLETVGGVGDIFTGTITAPADAPTGMHIMRVRMMWNNPPVPCGLQAYGEIEDYSVDVLVGIEELDASLFQVFPNPANEQINVRSSIELNRIQIISISGQLVFDEKVNTMDYQIDVSDFVSGMYFIKLETDEGTISRKITVK